MDGIIERIIPLTSLMAVLKPDFFSFWRVVGTSSWIRGRCSFLFPFLSLKKLQSVQAVQKLCLSFVLDFWDGKIIIFVPQSRRLHTGSRVSKGPPHPLICLQKWVGFLCLILVRRRALTVASSCSLTNSFIIPIHFYENCVPIGDFVPARAKLRQNNISILSKSGPSLSRWTSLYGQSTRNGQLPY